MPLSTPTPCLLIIGLAVACSIGSHTLSPQSLTFEPGQHTIVAGDILVELTHGDYDDRRVALRVAIQNRGAQPITIEREGVLLAYEDLEFPLAEDAPTPVARRTQVAPGQRVELPLTFVLQQALVAPAQLRLRALRRGDVWMETVNLEIPPPANYTAAAKPAEA